jgi:hypothetical protein
MDAETLARVEPESVDALARCVALAVVDGRGVVKAVVEHVDLGLALQELVGKPILPAAELQRLLAQPEFGVIRAQGMSVAGPVVVPRKAGGTTTFKGVATALAGSDRWLVALLDLDSPPSGRESELEGHSRPPAGAPGLTRILDGLVTARTARPAVQFEIRSATSDRRGGGGWRKDRRRAELGAGRGGFVRAGRHLNAGSLKVARRVCPRLTVPRLLAKFLRGTYLSV